MGREMASSERRNLLIGSKILFGLNSVNPRVWWKIHNSTYREVEPGGTTERIETFGASSIVSAFPSKVEFRPYSVGSCRMRLQKASRMYSGPRCRIDTIHEGRYPSGVPHR